ncbi:SixA phosphatase family protein [Gelidibacter maritimus]|uniref:Histidine phosphatase family protein n=1 Tax=Gelidibacter maritimus TaxID=2761487 RepID=A0A7W2R3A4_9FLAO|nr:histidine phosphatase family protein [Gelidibacter maritimus]MBA6152594.1 histidine phosphatase family protein [Gelidibacter maritimus]
MKTIVLIRHAKSSWDHDVSDLNRPLSKRGFTDANLVSKAFKSYGFSPDAIYSSPANRAITTCSIFMENLNFSKDLLTIDHKIYDFGGNQVRRFLKSLNEGLQKVVIFGHNHAFTSLVNSFGDLDIDNLPTSGLVMIDFNVNHWQDIGQGETKLYLKPKDFK